MKKLLIEIGRTGLILGLVPLVILDMILFPKKWDDMFNQDPINL